MSASTRTWLAAVLLSSLVGLAPATAETPAPGPATPRASKRVGKVPFRAVRLMPETQQALIYDRDRREHRVVRVGEVVGAFQVIAVDDDELVLARDGREIVLLVDPTAPPAPLPPSPALLDPYPTAAPAGRATRTVPIDPYGAGGATLDPYPAMARPGGATLDPYAATPGPGAATPREVLAPPGQRASLETAAVLDPYAEPKVVAAPAGAAPIKGVPAPTSEAARAAEIRTGVVGLQRAELQAAVASFDKLAKEHGFERTGRGIRILRVAPDSYAYGMGLRAGDHLTAIDGRSLRNLDDAAVAYVRLGTATRFTLDVERGAARGVLHFDLK